ncbi:MAG: DUF2085 domain-containing protein [Coriobacteriia bacterium]
MESILRWLGYGLCHQLAERSFFGGGLQVPVCARDTGIYAGFVIGLLALYAGHRGKRPSELPPWPSMILIGVFLGVMVFDGITSYAGLRPTTNDLRLLTGLTAGFALSALTLPLLNSQLWRRSDRDRVLGTPRAVASFVTALPVAFVGIRYGGPLLGVVYAVVVAALIVVTFSAVNLVIVCLVPYFERRAESWRDMLAPVTMATVLTFVELAGATELKLWLARFVGLVA